MCYKWYVGRVQVRAGGGVGAAHAARAVVPRGVRVRAAGRRAQRARARARAAPAVAARRLPRRRRALPRHQGAVLRMRSDC